MALDVKTLTEATNKLTGTIPTQPQEGKLNGYKIAAIVCGSVAAVAAIAAVVATVVFAAPLVAAGCTLAALGFTVAAIITGTRKNGPSLEQAASELINAGEAKHEELQQLQDLISRSPLHQKLIEETSNLKNLNTKIDDLQKELETLQNSDDASSAETQTRIQEITAEISGWTTSKQLIETVIERLKNKIENPDAEATAIQQKLEKAEKAVENLRKTNLSISSEKSDWEAKASNLEASLTETKSNNSSLIESVNKLISFFDRKVKGVATVINNKHYVSIENFESIVNEAKERAGTDKGITVSPPQEEATPSEPSKSDNTETSN